MFDAVSFDLFSAPDFALITVGLLVGFVAGMFGVGGGFLLTPILMYGFGIAPALAVGSSLSQQCGTAIASFLKYRSLNRGEPRIDLIMMGGSLIGVDAGGRFLRYISSLAPITLWNGRVVPLTSLTLNILFVVMLTLIAAFIFRDVWDARNRPPRGDVTIPGPLATKIRVPPYINLPRVNLSQVSAPMLGYLGFLLGFLSGMMGAGGGVMMTPVLLYGLGISARNAAATGILLLFVTVAFGTFQAALNGHVSLHLSLTLLIGSSIGAQFGALATNRLPNRTLRLAFACLVSASALALLFQLARQTVL